MSSSENKKSLSDGLMDLLRQASLNSHRRNEMDLVHKMVAMQTEAKFREIFEGIALFLEIAWLKRKGIIKNNFWGFERDTPTMIIEILSDLYLDTLLKKKISVEGVFSRQLEKGENVIYQAGGYWIFKFNGEAKIFQDRIRLNYLIPLIENEGKRLKAAEISAIVNKANLQKDPGVENLQLDDPYQHPEKYTEREEKIRDEAQKKFDKSELLGDRSQWEEFKTLILKEYGISLATDEEGTIKLAYLNRLKSDYEKIRKNVQKNISSAIKDFQQFFPALYNHFESSVHTGWICHYSPTPTIECGTMGTSINI